MDPKTSQVESAVLGKYTERWDTNNATNGWIWPTNVPGTNTPITNTHVLLKGAPDDALGNHQYLAFVVWNGNVVGHIYRVRKGPPETPNFNSMVLGAAAAQTSGAPSFTWSLTGNINTDPPLPRPGPTIDEWFIEMPELNNAKSTSQTIDPAIQGFENFAG